MSTTHIFNESPETSNLQGTEDSKEREAVTKRRGAITERGTIAIAERIAETRKDRAISQQQMAKKLGVTQPIISRYERGELRIHAELLVKIAKILSVTTDELLGLKPIEKQSKTTDELDTPSMRRMWKKFQQVAKWPEKDQRAVIRLINSVSEAKSA
jgi:transcriptional regulator with XRE-family HTH domain